ncbi:MAG: ABC transporter substrate-binding protein [Acidimicrobiales bacterium]|nr:ABC transporter substrate-binding protein [Acidimicrobiales bacterium]
MTISPDPARTTLHQSAANDGSRARAVVDRRRFLGMSLGAAVAGPALLSACGGSPPGDGVDQRHRDGILRIGVAGAPGNINPLDSGSELTQWPAEAVMESLYTYDESLASVPLLAAGEPVISTDRLNWTIALRNDVTFHNGDPFTAHHVVSTLDHLLDLSSGSEWITYLLDYVQWFEAADDHTVTIGLAQPYGLLRSHLTNLPMGHTDFVGRRDAMMGTGPYQLTDHKPGQSYTLTRYDRYHGPKPSFAGIEYSVFVDGGTRLLTLQQGRVDLITSLPHTNLKTVEQDPDLALIQAEAPLDVLTYVNLRAEPFSDENFRQAVAASMDRAGVKDRVFGGHATIGQGPIGPAQKGWDPDLDVFPARPDLARAERLLAQADTERRDFTITVGTTQVSRDIATVLAAGWKEVGLEVTIEQLTGGPWSSRWLANEYEMLMNTFQSGFTSGPANYMTLTPADSRSLLSCGFHDPEVDGWMDVIWQTEDDGERSEALTLLNRRLAEQAVMFPPVYPDLLMAQRRELSPVDPDGLRISRLRPQNLTFVP